ncbi:MFS transporter [Aeoliella sp. ICT_H6.2]|uniref:MFS transporter n=1 Tax=Aeoliella straminimaris TaxID=2954799 RepID=A0A9X2FHF4_9BACT|nr:MFS transporter [Aeoliella straminimaris]MCO6045981.1 MFS transporter [Aeoliella straminimaris]
MNWFAGRRPNQANCHPSMQADKAADRLDKQNRHTEGESALSSWTGNNSMANAFRALKHRNFQLFFAGQFISLTGTWMQSVAQSWLVYRLTGSVVLLGLIGFASQIPVFLLAALGGVVADRHDRRRILIATQTASMMVAFLLAGLTISGLVQVWHLFAVAVCFGVINAFDIPARQAFVPDMVGRDDLINAIALNSSMFNGARIVGPAIAGVLVALVGEGWCFFVNAVSFIAVIAGLLLMQLTPIVRHHTGSALENLVEGFHFTTHTAPIRALLLLLGVMSLMGMPYVVLMPIFAEKILGGNSATLGYLMGASGVGALIAALVLAAREKVFGLGTWVAAAAAGFGISLILFALSNQFWLSMLLLVPVGFTMMIQMAASNTLVQASVPDVLRGRVMSVYSMMFMGMAPVGSLLSGAVAGVVGAPTTVALGGVACILAGGYFAVRLPQLRDEGRRLIVALQMTGGDPAVEAAYQQPVLTGEEPVMESAND